MVAGNRLTGHSAGFFSVYTLPPTGGLAARAGEDQFEAQSGPSAAGCASAHSVEEPLTASRRDSRAAHTAGWDGQRRPARHRTVFRDAAIGQLGRAGRHVAAVSRRRGLQGRQLAALLVLRDRPSIVPVTLARQFDVWKAFVTSTLSEVRRILRPNGHVAFEVGEVRGGALRLEEIVIPAAMRRASNRSSFSSTRSSSRRPPTAGA